MKRIVVFAFFILAMCGFAAAQTSPRDAIEKVMEIKLLEATRDDVQRAFINYESEDYDFEEHSQEFYSDFADIEVSYSNGKCQENMANEAGDDKEEYRDDVAEIWNVVEWKATKIVIDFDEPIKIEDIGYNLSEFKKQKRFPDREDSDLFIYHSKNSGIALLGDEEEIEKIIFYPSKSSHSKLCDNEEAKKFASDENWFGTDELRSREIAEYTANVTDLTLSQTEVTADCGDAKNKARSNSVKEIEVSSVALDPENDVLTYNYTVSGGKIVGQGAKVLWDLSGVKPGTYTITAGVDDGCGVCGITQTRAVTVAECPKRAVEPKKGVIDQKDKNVRRETVKPPVGNKRKRSR